MTRTTRSRRLLRAPVLHFVLLGTLLFVVVRSLEPPQPREVTISRERIASLERSFARQTGAAPTERERAGLISVAIEDELWLSEARALGLTETDGVVQRRLIQVARFLDPSLTDDTSALAEARELGLDQTDPVVRRRLIERMRSAVRARARALPVSAEELERQYALDPNRYLEPERFRIAQVFISRDRHADRTPLEAERELSALRGNNLLPEQATGRGDPFIHGQRLGPQPGAGFAALFGSAFAAALETLPEGTWAGPVESAYGLHLVFIEDSTPPMLPPLAEVETRVREDLLEARSRKILRQSIDELRAHYTVRVEPGA